jgi:uncharacterized protein YjbI with pentapeptide repeats
MSTRKISQGKDFMEEISVYEDTAMDSTDHLVDNFEDGYEINDEDSAVNSEFYRTSENVVKTDHEGENYDYQNFRKRQMAFSNVSSCQFRYANLDSVNLIGTNINLTDFEGAKMQQSDLEYSEISRCNFSSSDLTNAKFRGARIKKSDFSWADLRGADFSDCIVQDTNFNHAMIDNTTVFPFSHEQIKKWDIVFVGNKYNNVG